MITIFKLTLANIKQKKFRSVLIIISILLSVALMYSILALSNSTTKIIEQKIKKEIGNAQLMILPKENSGNIYIPELNFENQKGIEYSIPLVTAYGYTEIEEDKIPITFTGMSNEDYDTIYGLEFVEETSKELSKNQVYIGEETSKEYQLTLGDVLKVTVGGIEQEFIIKGIVKDSNNLGYELGNLDLLIDKDNLVELLGLSGSVNGYYIKNMPDYDKGDLKNELEKSFADYEIKDISDLDDFKQMIDLIVMSLLIMVMAVIMVSAFIIYSSFKIIAIDRMPLMGTLRSVGATRKMTVSTLLSESFFYGLVGGVFGNALGVLILYGTLKMMFETFGVQLVNISYFNISYFILALLIGLGLAIGSAIIPIIKMSKKSIRSIIFAEIQNEKHLSLKKTIIGIVLIGLAFLFFNNAPLEFRLLLDAVGVIFVTVGGALTIPMISYLLTIILSLLLKPIYKDGLGVVTANIKNDRTMMNNVMLLAMGLGVILMINNFSSTVGTAVTDVYGTGKSDALVNANMDATFINEVSKLEDVEHVYTTKKVRNITANAGAINLIFLVGIDGRGYAEYAWNEFGKYLTDDLMKSFKSHRSIIISKFTASKYDLSVGDVLDIKLNEKDIKYEVIGIVPSIMDNGNISYVYDKYLIEDAGVNNYQSMYINIKDNADTKKVLQEIKELVPYGILPIQTLSDMKEQNMKANNAVFFLMKAVSVIAMFIGVIGILNNFTISFLSRRKIVATMRSLGLSKMKTISNMIFEASFCGLLGTVSGLLLGTMLVNAMRFVIEAIGVPAAFLNYSIKEYMFVFIAGLILSVLSAIFPAFSIARENIVSGLRYE